MDLITLVQQAETRLLREGRHDATIVVAFEADLPIAQERVVPFPATSEQRRHVLFLKGKQFASRYGTQRLATIWFVNEAWMSKAIPHAPFVDPSRDPHRQEVLVVVELDVTPPAFAQRIEVRQMKRNRYGKLKAVQPLPDLSFPDVVSSVLGLPALAFLAGFAEACDHPRAYGAVHTQMLWQQSQMDLWLGQDGPRE